MENKTKIVCLVCLLLVSYARKRPGLNLSLSLSLSNKEKDISKLYVLKVCCIGRKGNKNNYEL